MHGVDGRILSVSLAESSPARLNGDRVILRSDQLQGTAKRPVSALFLSCSGAALPQPCPPPAPTLSQPCSSLVFACPYPAPLSPPLSQPRLSLRCPTPSPSLSQPCCCPVQALSQSCLSPDSLVSALSPACPSPVLALSQRYLNQRLSNTIAKNLKPQQGVNILPFTYWMTVPVAVILSRDLIPPDDLTCPGIIHAG